MTGLPTSADVVVVGAGLAGLAAATSLADSGLDVVLVEEGDAPGGRVRTDRVDGVLLDRGFQLLNPSYPRLRHDVDLAALELRPFEAGAAVSIDDRLVVVGDPRRLARDLSSTLRLAPGSWPEKLAFVAWATEIGFGPAGRVKHRADAPLSETLRRRGLRGALTTGVLRPFLAGVLAENDLATSTVLAELLVRSFIRGTPAVPAAGMQALPEQLAARLPPGTLHLNTSALGVEPTRVVTDGGMVTARAVVLATDPSAAATLTGQPRPAMRALTTFYHLAPEPPSERALLHLDAQDRGPLVNTVVITNAAPSYAPGRVLVASTSLGADASSSAEVAALRHAASIYGVSTARWESIGHYPISEALPDSPPGTPIQRPALLPSGVFIAGDHRATASIQGALASGRHTARAVRAALA